MNILVFAPNVDIFSNTARATHTREVANNLVGLDNRVSVICRKEDTAEYNIRFNIFEVTSPDKRLYDKPKIAANGLYNLYGHINREKVDLIYSRDTYSIFSLIFSKAFSIPHVTEVNSSMLEVMSFESGGVMKVFGLLTEKSYNYSDSIIVVDEQIKQYLENKYSITSNINVIPNGVNIDLFRPIDRGKAIELTGLDDKYRYICFMGNLFSYQGVEYILEAVPSIIAHHPDIRFLIVGDGPMKSKLEDLAMNEGINEYTIFTGRVPHKEVPYYINSSSLCIVYKKDLQSGFSPLKLYEYLACGKPVVASDNSAHSIIDEYNAGELVVPEDHIRLGETINRLLENEDLEVMGKNGREFVERNRSWEATSEQLNKVFDKITKDK